MKITGFTQQKNDPNRINVMVDGKYRFSLDVFQIGDLGIKVGNDYDEKELAGLETESQFGKLYAQALDYSLSRPHSSREMRDYLYKKTLSKRYRSKRTGEIKERPGIEKSVTERVFERLCEKGYIDDEKFTRFWLEHRHQKQGASRRKLRAELAAKGVDKTIVEHELAMSDRSDDDELQKMIAKKRSRYPDEMKLIQYLARQGFAYDDIKQALGSDSTTIIS